MGWIQRAFERYRTVNDWQRRFPRVPLPEVHPQAGETICTYSCMEGNVWTLTFERMPTERQVVAETCPECGGESHLRQIDFHWENPY
jgi:hypothetical protein